MKYPEHPEDKARRLESQQWARTPEAAALIAKKQKELIKLLTIYPDGKAHDLLDNLREYFWTRSV